MKTALTLLFLLLFAAVSQTAAQTIYPQTIYTQTTLNCTITACSNAQFSPSATLSYTAPIHYYGGSFVNGTAVWDGVEYTDFQGKMTWLGYQNHYPYGTWQVQGTFDSGRYTVTEIFWCFRSCGSRSNVSGMVVGP
jgi:hypothetical protein